MVFLIFLDLKLMNDLYLSSLKADYILSLNLFLDESHNDTVKYQNVWQYSQFFWFNSLYNA